MNALIFSDTHNYINDVLHIIREQPIVNAVFHAGDHASDAVKIQDEFPQIPVYYVHGNCDISSSAPSEQLIEFGGKKIFITHGHLYNVKSGLDTLKSRIFQIHPDLAIFGHTHQSLTDYAGSTTIINPGAMYGYNKSYAAVSWENGSIRTEIKLL